MRTKSKFPTQPIERVAKQAGVKRISKRALRTLTNMTLDYAEDLAKDIVAVSKHCERNTVLAKDVMLVRKLQTHASPEEK